MSQSMQLTPNQAASVRAEQLAATYQLGTPQKEYGVHYTIWMLVCGIGVLLLAGLMAFYGYQLSTSTNSIDVGNAPFLLVLSGLALLGALYCLFYPLLYKSWRVYVCSEGFAFARGSKLDAFRWDQIDSVLFLIATKYMYGAVSAGTQYKYTVRGMNGAQVVLNNRMTGIKELGETIRDMVTKVKLPQDLAAFKAGNTLKFGPLSINLQGVSNGRETIPWNQITQVQVSNGSVIIQKEGKWLSWSSVQVANIPNFFIFLALVDAIGQGAV